MTLEIKHADQIDTGVWPDDGVSPVGSNEWNAALVAVMATARLLGRVTGGLGAVEELTAAQVKAFLAYGTAAAADTGVNAGNVPVLDGSGLLNAAVLPALAITDIFEVASQAAMLALVAQKGDVAIRSDLNKTYALASNSPGTLADWKELKTPTDVVLAVAGLTGTITAASLKTALAITVASITDMTANARSLMQAADYAAMFGLLKIAASQTATGVVELATDAETQAGTDATRAVTPAGLQSRVGTAANKLVALDGSAKLPAVDGSLLTNLPVSSPPGLVLISAQTISSSIAAVDFTGLSSAYDEYELHLQNVTTATASTLSLRTSTNNGSSFDAGATDYMSARISNASSPATPSGSGQQGDPQLNLSSGVVSSGVIRIMAPAAVTQTQLTWHISNTSSAATVAQQSIGAGFRTAASDVDAIRLFAQGLNLTSGLVKLYGVRKV